MLGSVQDKLTRVRPPRVKITYDVETLGAQEKKELPFIAGIFADLSGEVNRLGSDGGKDSDGNYLEALPVVADRKMVQVDPDTFEKVMDSCKPAVDLLQIHNVLEKSLDERLQEESKKKNTDPDADFVEINAESVFEELEKLASTSQQYVVFSKLEHFEPAQLITRIKPLSDLYDKRVALRELHSKSEMILALQDLMEHYVPPTEPEDDDAAAARKKSVDELAAFAGQFVKMAAALEEKKQAALQADPPKELSDEEIQKWMDDEYLSVADNALYADASSVKAFFEDGMLKKDDSVGYRAYEIVAAFAEIPAFAEDFNSKLKPKDDIPGLAATFDNMVADIDAALSRQLDEILHNDKFQELEATWRGLAYLLNNSETSGSLKLRIMNVSKKELLKELDKAVEFDQSSIFKRIYEYEYGTYGGHPYSMLLGGYEFGRSPDDQRLLRHLSGLAAAAHAPFIASAYAQLFDMETYESLAKPRDLSKIFESVELAEWRGFRESEDSRYVALALPRVLFRLPWGGEKGETVDIIDYEENVMDLALEGELQEYDDGSGKTLQYRKYGYTKQKSVNGQNMLWGLASWVLAQRITNAHATYGWTAAIRGVEGGGLVSFLPNYTYTSKDGDIDQVCPTQVSITDRREKELNDLGFMAICHCKNEAKAAFFGGQSTNLPKKYLLDAATANAQLSSQLPYMLCASRFAHYIKVMMREKVGAFMTASNVEKYLNNWIAEYVLLDDEAPQDIKAKYPLRAANVVVTDDPAKPGAYKATVFLRPHFQLEELTTSIRLVAEIPG